MENKQYEIGTEIRPSAWIIRQKALDLWDKAGCLSYFVAGETEKAVRVDVHNDKLGKWLTTWFPKSQVQIVD